MRLFTVPTGQRITEKYLYRVLVSSICSILLCMTCLVSTTWAWFTVSIENTGNEVRIGKPEIRLEVNGSAFATGLQAGENTVHIEHANEVDDLQKKSTLYVTLTIDAATTVFTTLSHENGYKAEFTIITGGVCPLSWHVSWFAPANATALTGDTITVSEEVEVTGEITTTGTTEPSTTEGRTF